MNKIKGLLIKDLLELKSYKKNFIVSLLIYGVIILTSVDDGNTVFFGSSMIMFLFSIYALATFSYDEKSKSDRYILTFPLTKKEIILSKYIFAFVSILVGAIIGILFSIILSCITIRAIPNMENLLSSILGVMVVLSLMQSIQIPCIYKYGAEKGRLQIYLIIMGLGLVIVGINMLFPNIDLSLLNSINNFLPIVLIFLIFINYVISYNVSCKIYLKKEV